MAMKIHRTALAAAASLILGSGIALAGEPKEDTKAERDRGVPGVDVDVDMRLRMSKLDTNKDDKISKIEAKADAKLLKEFAKLDKDKNSLLDRGEFSKFEIDVDIGEPGDQPNSKPSIGEPGDQPNRPYTKDDATDDVKEDKLGPGR